MIPSLALVCTFDLPKGHDRSRVNRYLCLGQKVGSEKQLTKKETDGNMELTRFRGHLMR